ncbi:MAG: hypothetical protein V8Q84_05125 [Bilophila sp.]
MNIRCRHRIPSPEAAGYATVEELQGGRRALSAPAALQETRVELAIPDVLREVPGQA